MASNAGITKQRRMRKGTHSCLACRRRKIKCIFPSSTASVCNGCASRATECIPQGIVDDDEDVTSGQPVPGHDLPIRNSEDNTARLASLLGELERLVDSGNNKDTVERLGATIDRLKSTDRGLSPPSPPSPSVPLSEQPMQSGTAPLMRLLDDSVLNRSSARTVNGRPRTETPYLPTSSAARAPKDHRKYRDAVRELLSYLPSNPEAEQIYELQSSWWLFWRSALGLVFGDSEAISLKEFASQALKEKSPCLLGLLLVCLAVSTNDPRRFMPPVEKWILTDDEWASTEHGISCLMAGSIVYLNVLQPRRAWVMNRRAISLLQLNGLHHSHKRLEKHETLFWEIFHADRWISLAVGMPYSMADHFCDLSMPPITKLGASTWLYRQLAILSGRVIDSLQGVNNSSMAAALEIDEKLEALKTQIPANYLDMEVIRGLSDKIERHVRLYRVIHWRQLRMYVYLPLLLRSRSDSRYEFGRKTAVDDARVELEAYLACFESDPSTLSNGSVINFHAFIAAVVVLLSLMGYGRQQSTTSTSSSDEADWKTIFQVLETLKATETGMAGVLSKQCRTALESLVRSARAVDSEEFDAAGEPTAKTVVLPYFGTISISRSTANTKQRRERASIPQESQYFGMGTSPVTTTTWAQIPPLLASQNDVYMDIDLAYYGPYMPTEAALQQWPMDNSHQDLHATMGQHASFSDYSHSTMPWQNVDENSWNWLNADLPPSMTF